MKGLILSGGKGTRLRPLTFTQAKQLVPVANKPVLFYGIEALKEAGIEEIGIIVGDTKDEIRAAAGDGSRWGIRLTYIEQEAPLGLAHAVKISEEFLGKETFVMYLGDNILKSGIKSLVEEFQEDKPNSLILLTAVPNAQMFGVAELKDGKVVRLVEKPKVPKSNLALVGVYMFDFHIFEAVKAIKPSWRNELEITDAIQYLVEHGYNVRPHIVNSIIRGPAIIGKGCEITDAYIGPFTSIQKGCRISETEIEHSIVLEGSEIQNVGSRIDESLIGRRVKIFRGPSRPAVYRFMVGDQSEIGIK